jgi:cellulose 1,4-beta-cellobiosidase
MTRHRPRRIRTVAAVAALGAAALVPIAGTQSAHAGAVPKAAVAAVHVANPYVGSTPYLNPDYVNEVNAQATADGGTAGAAEAKVADYQTAIWMDHIGAIAGDSTHLGLQAQLNPGAVRGGHLRPAGP